MGSKGVKISAEEQKSFFGSFVVIANLFFENVGYYNTPLKSIRAV